MTWREAAGCLIAFNVGVFALSLAAGEVPVRLLRDRPVTPEPKPLEAAEVGVRSAVRSAASRSRGGSSGRQGGAVPDGAVDVAGATAHRLEHVARGPPPGPQRELRVLHGRVGQAVRDEGGAEPLGRMPLEGAAVIHSIRLVNY